MLIKTTSELQNFEAIEGNLAFDKLKPYITNVEENYIVKALGAPFYSHLVNAYNQNPQVSGIKGKVLHRVQSAIVPLAIADAAPVLELSISDAGVHRRETSEEKTPYQYQVTKLIESKKLQGLKALNSLHNFMEANANVNGLQLYKNSDERKARLSHFISSPQLFAEHFGIDTDSSFWSYIALENRIHQIETIQIKKILGNDLYTSMIDKLKVGESVENEHTEILKYVRYATANLAVAQSISTMSIRFTQHGIMIFNNDNSKTSETYAAANFDRIKMLQSDAEATGNAFLEELQEALQSPNGFIRNANDNDENGIFNAL